MRPIRELECLSCEQWFPEEAFERHVQREHFVSQEEGYSDNMKCEALCGAVREVFFISGDNANAPATDNSEKLIMNSVKSVEGIIDVEDTKPTKTVLQEILGGCIENAVSLVEARKTTCDVKKDIVALSQGGLQECDREEIDFDSDWSQEQVVTQDDMESREGGENGGDEDTETLTTKISSPSTKNSAKLGKRKETGCNDAVVTEVNTGEPLQKRPTAEEVVTEEGEAERRRLDEYIDEKCEKVCAEMESDTFEVPCESDFNDSFNIDDSNDELKVKGCRDEVQVMIGNFPDYFSGKATFGRGVILAKAGPKKVSSLKAAEGTHTNLTLSDQGWDSANCTVWAETEAEAHTLETEFHVGDVVQFRGLSRRQKTEVKHDELDPVVTSQFKLKFIRGESVLKKVDRNCFKGLEERMRTPFFGNGIEITLQEITHDKSLLNKFVTVSGVIKECTHDIQVSRAQMMASILLASGDVTVKLKLWDSEQRSQAKKWSVGESIHCSGVKVETDIYKGNLCLTGSSKTVLVRL